jgi:hypothetical protein
MKTINNYIHERLILSKTGKQQEITFDMLFNLIRKNAPEEDIYFSSIFGHDNKIFLDKNYSNKSNKFYPGLELETIIVYKGNNKIIELTQVDDDNNMWTAARITNNAELYEAFEPDVIESIYNYFENYKK